MKRIFLIFILLVAINFSSPNSQTLSQILRHKVEFTEQKRQLDTDEVLKNKIRLEFLRLVLEMKIRRLNSSLQFADSS